MGFTKKEIEQSNNYIRALYGYRCVRCSKKASMVHEIEPRSKRPNDWIAVSNRVLLCAICHEFIHANGTANYEWELQLAQARVLGLNGG